MKHLFKASMLFMALGAAALMTSCDSGECQEDKANVYVFSGIVVDQNDNPLPDVMAIIFPPHKWDNNIKKSVWSEHPGSDDQETSVLYDVLYSGENNVLGHVDSYDHILIEYSVGVPESEKNLCKVDLGGSMENGDRIEQPINMLSSLETSSPKTDGEGHFTQRVWIHQEDSDIWDSKDFSPELCVDIGKMGFHCSDIPGCKDDDHCECYDYKCDENSGSDCIEYDYYCQNIEIAMASKTEETCFGEYSSGKYYVKSSYYTDVTHELFEVCDKQYRIKDLKLVFDLSKFEK